MSPAARGRASISAGWAAADLTPPVGTPLAGCVTRQPRLAETIRDRLSVRALHLAPRDRPRDPDAGVTLVVADVLVITSALHRASAERAGLPPHRLVASASHTHSGPGAYWEPSLPQRFMGPYDPSALTGLAQAIADVALAARERCRPCRVHSAAVTAPGASQNRRQAHGPVDPELRVVRFEPGGPGRFDRTPLALLHFGAHPVVMSERAPHAISADWPGEWCRRVEARGVTPMFLQGVVGGLSPLFPEFETDADTHLALLGDVFDKGFDRAWEALAPVEGVRDPVARLMTLPLPPPDCRIVPTEGAGGRLAEVALTPLRRWMTARGKEARPEDAMAPVHLVDAGALALVGTPADLGVNVGLALKRLLAAKGVTVPLVASHTDGYVGYVHLERDYAVQPTKGFRHMAYYENAMSLSGWDLGDRIVDAVGDAWPLTRG